MLKENKEKKLVILSAILGVLFVVLFYDHKIGVSYTIYTIAMIIFYYYALTNIKFNRLLYFLGSTYILLLSTIFFRSDFLLFKVLNFFAIPLLFSANLAIHTGKQQIGKMVSNIVVYLIMPIGKMDKFFRTLAIKKSINQNSYIKEKITKVLLGVIIVVPVLFIVIPLMSSADAVFAHKLVRLTDFTGDIIKADSFIKIIMGLLAASFLFGQIYYIFYDKDNQKIKPSEVIISDFKGFDRTVTVTFLIVLDGIYSIFSVIQFVYLFGGNGINLPAGYTYSDYAREGFFQLVLLSVINIALIFVINRFYLGVNSNTDKDRENNKYKKDIVVNTLLFIMVLCTFIMMISSIYRMSLYEAAYGYTRLRLLVYMFLIFEAIIMVLVAYSIWNKKFPLIRVAMYVALISYLIVNFINIDSIIAKENINRYKETGDIDSYYLFDLSADAIGEMEQLKEIDEKMYNDYIKDLINKEYDVAHQSWQSFNLSEYKAKKTILNIKKQ